MSKLEKPIKAKKALTLCVVCALVCSLLTAAYVYASSPSTFQVITSGVVPGAEYMTVFLDTGVYYAKNMYGGISYSSTNATYVLQSALSLGGSIFIKAGTYNIGQLRPVSNSIIKGEGNGTILKLLAGANTPVIYIGSNAYDVEVCNLNIDGNGINQAVGSYSTGVKIGSGNHISVHDNFIHDTGSSGIEAGNVGSADYVDYDIYNNVITDVGQVDAGDGIGLEPVSGYSIQDCAIHNNVISDCNRYGIMFYREVNNNAIYSNQISNVGTGTVYGYGIVITGSYNSIYGNTIRDTTATSGKGINLVNTDSLTYYPTGNTVTANTIYNFVTGISISGINSTGNTITANTVSSCTTGFAEINNAYGNTFSSNKPISCGTTYGLNTTTSLFGASNMKWGTVYANDTTAVAHGLGDTPDVVLVCANSYTGNYTASASNYNATHFLIQLTNIKTGVAPTEYNIVVSWIAIKDD
jgi:hypothetical protein